VKDGQERFGLVRGADGRQRWIRAVDLHPASGSRRELSLSSVWSQGSLCRTDADVGDRNYLVLAKPNVIMNDIRLRGLGVAGSDAAGRKSPQNQAQSARKLRGSLQKAAADLFNWLGSATLQAERVPGAIVMLPWALVTRVPVSPFLLFFSCGGGAEPGARRSVWMSHAD
jgi:hypothetical protein